MKVKISHYRWIAAIIIILLFIYMVLLEDVLTVSMPLEWLEQHRHESAEMRYMDPIYTMKEMASAVFHQVSTLSGGPIHNVYAWDSLLLIISTLLWESLFCFIIIPEGFCLREKNLIQHMVFSAIFASISLFQILKSLRNDPQKFFLDSLVYYHTVFSFDTSQYSYQKRRTNSTRGNHISYALDYWICYSSCNLARTILQHESRNTY